MRSIKKIRLSGKKGGTGYVSSYSVSIGRQEALACGFTEDPQAVICKIVDTEKGEIIIKPKRCLLTKEMVEAITEAAEEVRRQETLQMADMPETGPVISISDIPLPNEAVRKAETRFAAVLDTYSKEEQTDYVTLLVMGRAMDADMTMDGEERFLDYWGYLSEGCLFQNDLCSYILEHFSKRAIECGIRILKAPAQNCQEDE